MKAHYIAPNQSASRHALLILLLFLAAILITALPVRAIEIANDFTYGGTNGFAASHALATDFINYPVFSAVGSLSIYLQGDLESVGSATLLDNEWVLTAGHCWSTNVTSFDFVLAGTSYAADMSSLVLHPLWENSPSPLTNMEVGPSQGWDLALFKLASPITNSITFPKLYTKSDEFGKVSITLGAGRLGTGTVPWYEQTNDPPLVHAAFNVIDRTTSQTNSSYGGGFIVTDFDGTTNADHNTLGISYYTNGDATGIASQIFDNSDFGYYKVAIERPDRRRAAFSAERIAPLRFDNQLREPMQWLWEEHGGKIYQSGALQEHTKATLSWCEEQGITLNAKQRAKLLDTKHWLKLRALHDAAAALLEYTGTQESDDFNAFRKQVDKAIKTLKLKLSASEKNAILNAVSWYDATAARVIARQQEYPAEELAELCEHLGCAPTDLPDFGFYPQTDGSYLTYESASDLRDSEAVPLQDSIHRYFVAEVKPHVPEAWINLDSVRIGYEISFNKYFYRHKPLRRLEDVTADILKLEAQADGLIAEILGAAQ